jgi:hypothetical protein
MLEGPCLAPTLLPNIANRQVNIARSAALVREERWLAGAERRLRGSPQCN